MAGTRKLNSLETNFISVLVKYSTNTVQGHRKYVLKAAPRASLAESQIVQLLRPPGYIHGDPNELRLSVDSGMFVIHFSRFVRFAICIILLHEVDPTNLYYMADAILLLSSRELAFTGSKQ